MEFFIKKKLNSQQILSNYQQILSKFSANLSKSSTISQQFSVNSQQILSNSQQTLENPQQFLSNHQQFLSRFSANLSKSSTIYQQFSVNSQQILSKLSAILSKICKWIYVKKNGKIEKRKRWKKIYRNGQNWGKLENRFIDAIIFMDSLKWILLICLCVLDFCWILWPLICHTFRAHFNLTKCFKLAWSLK